VVEQLRDENPDLADVDEAGVRERFDHRDTESWRYATDRIVEATVGDADLADRVDELLAQQLGSE
jgi:hypothetical protein